MNQATFARSVLTRLGVRPSNGAMQAMLGWMAAEGGHWHNTARYNPLNTTLNLPGSGDTGSQGNISVYRNWQQGIDATVKTLKNGNYGGIIHAFKAGNPSAVAHAIDASPWGTHGSLVYNAISSAPSSAGGGGKVYAGSQPSAGATKTYTSTVPNVAANNATAQQAALHYLSSSDGPNSNSLIDLASTLAGANQTQTVKRTVTTPAKSNTTGYAGEKPRQLKGLAGTTTFEGKTVASWIAPVLAYARKQGWKGQVNSGYRSYAQQKAIYDSGVRPAAVPGTSNHEGSQFPRGAVDVSDADQLSAILLRSPYKHLLQYAGSKDPVHFSHPHRGAY